MTMLDEIHIWRTLNPSRFYMASVPCLATMKVDIVYVLGGVCIALSLVAFLNILFFLLR